ncbi:MAG: methyltransferase domain-containing protein [Lentisphaeria bacterium]|nr:methyltransferase domain-containing protein [Lentisphaeria bacterium]
MKRTLLGQFLKKPRMTGAVCSSSQGLARMLVTGIDLEHAQTVAELGPGTGAVTGAILDSMSPSGRFFAVELNDDIISTFKARFPAVKIYNDSAANLPDLLQRENMEALDAVISGLPWAIFPDDLQKAILDAVTQSLKPGGFFTTFAYLQGVILPSGQHFRKQLAQYFSLVEKSPVVWRNFPPAFVYRCRK